MHGSPRVNKSAVFMSEKCLHLMADSMFTAKKSITLGLSPDNTQDRNIPLFRGKSGIRTGRCGRLCSDIPWQEIVNPIDPVVAEMRTVQPVLCKDMPSVGEAGFFFRSPSTSLSVLSYTASF
jgi:hypothetical protein